MASESRTATRGKMGDVLLVVLLAWAVVASSFAVFNYAKVESLSAELSSLRASLAEAESELRALRARVVLVNVAIDYGNGTVKWFNSTPLLVQSTVLKALLAVASRVEYTYSAWGAYVTSIDGVSERIITSNEGYSWLWYIYDTDQRKWVFGPVAADQHVLKDGDTIMWRYEHWSYRG